MASPKGNHYNNDLTAVLLRGPWADATPGHTPNTTPLSWGELVRKWGKHTGGNTALIHHLRDISLLYLSSTAHPSTASSGFLTVPPPGSASPTRATSALPADQPRSSESSPSASAATSASADSSGASHGTSSFVHIPHPHLRHRHKASLDGGSNAGSGSSTVRAGETASGAGSGSRAAYLSAGDLDGDESEDPRGWAEGNGWWVGVGAEGVEEVREGIRKLEGLISSGKLKPEELTSAQLTLAYHLHALGAHDAALRIYSQMDWSGENRFGVVQGDAAVVERIRARCLQGLSYELLPTPDYPLAIQSYLATIPLLKSLSSFPLPTPGYLSSSRSATATPGASFEPHREVFRHLSTALTRASVLSARQSGTAAVGQTLRILRTYHALSASWPAGFRPVQRQKMLVLYLRALISSYPPAHAAPPASPILLYGSGDASAQPARALWKSEVLSAISNAQTFLSGSTSFPRAGSLNIPVTIFSSLCVSLAELDPSLARAAISVLWWAMTLTFQSQSVLRHLAGLLGDVGDTQDAKRVFELYVKLVLKARQTQQPEVSLQLKRRPADDDAAHPDEINRQAQAAAATSTPAPMSPESTTTATTQARKTQTVEVESDSDEEFVRALLRGARLLCRDMGEADEAWRYVCLAGDVVELIKGREGDGDLAVEAELEGKVEEAKGVVRMAMTAAGVDPLDRPSYQSQALNHLSFATTAHPTPSGFYHLAYCQAEARRIPDAIASIRSSLEMDAQNVQAWHLLGLLLTARRDWEGAKMALEAGVRVWEEKEEEEEEAGGEGRVVEGAEAEGEVEAKDFAAPSSGASAGPPTSTSTRQPTTPLLLPTGHFPPLPPSHPCSTPALTRSALLEHIIRLRMTLNVLTEKTLGPEQAMLKQQELFAFFSARSGRNRGKMGYGRGFGKAGGVAGVPGSGGGLPGRGKGGGGRESGSGGSEEAEDLGGSFVSVANDGSTNPGSAGYAVPALAPPIPPTPTTSLGANPGVPTIISRPPSTPNTPGDATPEQRTEDEEPRESRRRSLSIRGLTSGGAKDNAAGSGGKAWPKHLGVPASVSRPGSIRGASRPSSPTGNGTRSRTVSPSRNRTASTSTTALSLAPTAHSHFRAPNPHSSHGHPRPPPPPPIQAGGAAGDHGRTPAESRILSDLWLMSAATFRRWGKPEQGLVAIEEAEVLDPGNADVWVQLGMYEVMCAGTAGSGHGRGGGVGRSSGQPGVGEKVQGGEDDWKKAEAAFTKALLLKPDYPPAVIGLSKLYLSQSTPQSTTTTTTTLPPTPSNPNQSTLHPHAHPNPTHSSFLATSQSADLAEALLNQLTQQAGWDVPEAWYWLGKVAELQGREERARECWGYALGLEEGRAVRGWGEVARWL
ncbi:hypothetical protein IAT38_002393 [Cryptococcus sp. DSM 104549]